MTSSHLNRHLSRHLLEWSCAGCLVLFVCGCHLGGIHLGGKYYDQQQPVTPVSSGVESPSTMPDARTGRKTPPGETFSTRALISEFLPYLIGAAVGSRELRKLVKRKTS